MAGDTQAEYWADLEAYEQRSLAAKRPKVRALPQLPSAERYQGPVSPEAPSAEASSAAPAVEAIGAPFAEADDLADVPTDREDFDDSESDDEDAALAAGPSNAGGGEEGAEQTAMVELPDRYARPGREGWATRNKDKYACQAGGQRVLEQNEKIALQVRVRASPKPKPNPNPNPNPTPNPNQLDKLADKYKTQVQGEQKWRQYAYSKAAKAVRGLAFPVSCASELRGVRGIGDSVRDKVQEIIETGGLRRLAAMENDERLQGVDQLCKVHGVGAVIANEWYATPTRTRARTLP